MQNELKNATQQDIINRLTAEPDGAIFYHPASITGGEVQDMRERGLIRTGQDQNGYSWIRLVDSDEADDPQ
jgi:hypothetical protein